MEIAEFISYCQISSTKTVGCCKIHLFPSGSIGSRSISYRKTVSGNVYQSEEPVVVGCWCKFIFFIQRNNQAYIEISVYKKQDIRRSMLRERQAERSGPEAAMQS